MARNPDGMLAPAGNAEELFLMVPGIKSLADFDFKFLVDIDSTDMHPGIWSKLARIIYENYNTCDGFVIAHGTDTMAYTASALSFALQNLNKPIVLTGAQKPIIDLASDALNNLINAAKVALLDVPEVCIVFGNRILRGNRSQKISEKNLNAFRSPVALPLGCVALEPEAVAERVLRGNGGQLRFCPDFENQIVSFQIFPGLNKKYIELAIDSGCKGIILNSYGAGNVPNGENSLIPAIKKATDKKIPAVLTTQCVEGSVRIIYEAGSAAVSAGAISAFDMTSEATTAKLMWVLAQTKNLAEIKKMMQTNYCGEITLN